MNRVMLGKRLRYNFDNTMARGTGALILWLFAASLALIAVISAIVVVFGFTPADRADLGFVDAFWMGLMRTLDAGTMGGDEGGWAFLLSMFAVTLGGIFIVSSLIGVLTSGIEEKLAELRKGRSVVAERDHTVILGWSPQIFREWFLPMIREQVALIHRYDGIADYYDDGKLMGILPFLAAAGVDLVETCTPPPVGDFDIARAKAEFGDRLAFKGYVDLIYVLQKGTVEDVRRQVYEACTVGGKGGGFVLGTSDSMREGTPIENIDAYFRYGREYGRQR